MDNFDKALYKQFGIRLNDASEYAGPENPFEPSPDTRPPNPYIEQFKKEFETFASQHSEVKEHDMAIVLTEQETYTKASMKYQLITFKGDSSTEVVINDKSTGNEEKKYVSAKGLILKNITSKGYATVTFNVDFNAKADQATYSTFKPLSYVEKHISGTDNPNTDNFSYLIWSTLTPSQASKKYFYTHFVNGLERGNYYSGWLIYNHLFKNYPKLKRSTSSKIIRFAKGMQYFMKCTKGDEEVAYTFQKIADRPDLGFSLQSWNPTSSYSEAPTYVKKDNCWSMAQTFSNSLTFTKGQYRDILTNCKELHDMLGTKGFEGTKELYDGFPSNWKSSLIFGDNSTFVIQKAKSGNAGWIIFTDVLEPKGSKEMNINGTQFKFSESSLHFEYYKPAGQTIKDSNSHLVDYITNNTWFFSHATEQGWKSIKQYSDKLCISPTSTKIPLEGTVSGDLSGGTDNLPPIPDGEDSKLSGGIKDLLVQHKKTFYLLGFQGEETLPKLYLFNLGNIRGVLTYTHIEKAIRYRATDSCGWEPDSDTKEDKTFKFSSCKKDVDTNFYLLTFDKLDRPPTITEITHRKANAYLLKYFPNCKQERPEGSPNPDDTLKPEWGGGSGGNGNLPDSGQGGFFPEHNNPLPDSEVPPCSGGDGGSQTPVSEITLLSVPELNPSYADTYDFNNSKEAQEKFFKSREKKFEITNYSYLRKDNAIQVGSHVDNLRCYNYLMYKNKVGKWYYCFIMDKIYINERTTRLIIATDIIQTYLGEFTVQPSFVERCHVKRWNGDQPTPEYEPEGLEFGDPVQIQTKKLENSKFNDTYVAICANPLGKIPSRSIKKEGES